MGDVTQLIAKVREGDRGALDRIFELLYPELREVAHRRLSRTQRDDAVGTTALVNECYVKLVQRERLAPADRAHFLAYSATVMRSIIVDAARTAGRERHGGDWQAVTLDSRLLDSMADPAGEILGVHAALQDLAAVDARLAQVVEMRYFGGLEEAEIAEVLGVSRRTVSRDWEKARLLLAHALRN